MPKSNLAEEHLQSGTIEKIEYKNNDVGWIGRASNNTDEKKFVWNQDTLIQDKETFNLEEPRPSMSEGLLDFIESEGVDVIHHHETNIEVRLEEFKRKSIPAETFQFQKIGNYTSETPDEKQFILQK